MDYKKMSLAELSIFKARESVGVKEETTNWGKWVSVYLKFIGIFSPAPWCAAFLAYKIHQAAKIRGIEAKWLNGLQAGLCQNIYNWARKNGYLLKKPVDNCVFLVRRRGRPVWYSHVGFVTEVYNDGRFGTIEGNSNRGGSREGNEVVARTRDHNDGKYVYVKIV